MASWTRSLLLAIFMLDRLLGALSDTDNQDVIALQLISKSWRTSQLNWTGYDPCGSFWRGVTCNQTSVTELISNRGDISGTLSTAVGGMINLKTLDLSFNPNLGGPIPVELGKLTKLTFLSFQGCQFSGSVPPELGRLSKVQFFALNMNKLTGDIPPELGGLSSVTWFDIAENGLTGVLPVSSSSNGNIGLDNMTKVVHIHLFNNSLSGSLPKELSTLKSLRHLMVDNNLINGSIPPEYGDFVSLEILRVDNNRVTGTIPSTLGQIPNLFEFYVSNNSITGTLPDFSNYTKVRLINVGQNVYDPQPVPPSVLNLNTLQTLNMDQSNLNGTFPNDIFKLPLLELLSLASNRFTGVVDFGQAAPRLQSVNLNGNSITQVISVGGQFNLSLIGNPVCSDPRYHFSDQVCIPVNLDKWNSSTPEACTINCTNGLIRNEYFCSCALPLTVFFQFNGPTFSDITTERMENARRTLANQTLLAIEQVTVAAGFWLSNHRLQMVVYLFPNKTDEQMTYQEAQRVLKQIALHTFAQFPSEFGPYSINYVSVSLPGSGAGASKLSTGAIAGISVAAVIAFLALGVITFYALFQKRRADKALSMPFTSWGSFGKSGSAPMLKGARYFTLQELRKITNNFHNEIGVGGYGKVFKGVLLTGEAVAIKRAEEGSMQGSHEFKTEIEILSRVHHRNLVGLIGFCYEQGVQMLVYEYMTGGSLKDVLSAESIRLNWQKRVEIALDSAKGLTYLHELANPPIIHRDIKSSNILLTESLAAKVADFGLGKLGVDQSKTHISTQVKGTLGYMDPEYYMTQQLTEKSDVYSFGVVLLELLTARPPIVRGKYVVREVKTALDRGGLSALVSLLDPNLDDFPQSDLIKFVDLALQCVEESGTSRPSMNQVVKQLEALLPDNPIAEAESGEATPGGHLYDDPNTLVRSGNPEFAYSGVFQSRILPK